MVKRAYEDDIHEEVLIGGVGAFRPKEEPLQTSTLRELLKSRSDRSTGTVFITIGKSTLVCSGRHAQGLAEALLRHVEHLGARADLLVYDEVLESE